MDTCSIVKCKASPLVDLHHVELSDSIVVGKNIQVSYPRNMSNACGKQLLHMDCTGDKSDSSQD